MAPSVLIIGASGTVGRPLVQKFLKNKANFGRIAVLADPTKVSRFADVQSQGVEMVIGSFLEASSYKGFDTVISLAGNAAMKLQPAMIDAVIAGGVRHFYPSELGTDISYGAIGKKRYFCDKIATREHLRDRTREFAPLPFNNVDVEKHTASPYGAPDAMISVTLMPDIMRYVVESVLLPLEQGKSFRELQVAGETLTWAALMEALGDVQGVKYNIREHAPPNDVATRHRMPDEPSGGAGWLHRMFSITYLDPREAAEKEEAARVAGDTEAEMLWARKTLFATGVAHIHGPLDNTRFAFIPENAKETLQRLFGKK
ncbi:hypothetical protein B0H19DRAFT_1213594 [Mycena capillaripes]|nr:hypothetical protein B0H19DRAFT_1213594 [Mycena capillaripes]